MTISGRPDLAVLAEDVLHAAGLDASAIADWRAAMQSAAADYHNDCHSYSAFWSRSSALLHRLPPKPKRSDAEAAAAAAILAATREHRERFLTAHAATLYDTLTRDRARLIRLETLVFEAAAAVPGLTPPPDEIAAESALPQRDKEGIEIDQGIFLARVLANES